MDEEEPFLRAVESDIHDDAPRLVYADWLDERGDPRGEYLRLQVRFAREWTYQDQLPKELEREAELRAELPPEWFARVRRCTTPAAPVNVTELIPSLKPLKRKAVRLHPRLGGAPPDASKVGGSFLYWPRNEAWPECEEHGLPFVPAVQLRKEDVPGMEFPRGTDLFQLLWCPIEHQQDGDCAKPRVFWRERAAVSTTIGEELRLEIFEDEACYIPRE